MHARVSLRMRVHVFELFYINCQCISKQSIDNSYKTIRKRALCLNITAIQQAKYPDG